MDMSSSLCQSPMVLIPFDQYMALIKTDNNNKITTTTSLCNENNKVKMNSISTQVTLENIKSSISTTKISLKSNSSKETITSIGKRKRSTSTLPNIFTMPTKKDSILDDIKLNYYTKGILHIATICPPQDAQDMKCREEYMKYSLNWRLRRAIELAKMDIEQKYGK
jgi:hypothetical protein